MTHSPIVATCIWIEFGSNHAAAQWRWWWSGSDQMAWPSPCPDASDLHVINGIIKCDSKWNCRRHSTEYQYLFGFYLHLRLCESCAMCGDIYSQPINCLPICVYLSFHFICISFLLNVHCPLHSVSVYIHDADAFIYCHLLSFQVMHRLSHTLCGRFECARVQLHRRCHFQYWHVRHKKTIIIIYNKGNQLRNANSFKPFSIPHSCCLANRNRNW